MTPGARIGWAVNAVVAGGLWVLLLTSNPLASLAFGVGAVACAAIATARR